jgi:hypothetical protein
LPQCRLDPARPSSSPSAFPSFGTLLFMQYVAAKLLLNGGQDLPTVTPGTYQPATALPLTEKKHAR